MPGFDQTKWENEQFDSAGLWRVHPREPYSCCPKPAEPPATQQREVEEA